MTKSLSWRRFRNLALLAALAMLLLVLESAATAALWDTARLSGWILLAMIAGLALYNIRKRLPFLPLGSSASWLQIHIYMGLLTGIVFGLHIRWSLPEGIFETTLALLYAAVFASGVFGLLLSRSFARRLTTRGEEVLFERIPIYRQLLQAEVENLVLRCLADTESTAIPQFYTSRLKPFFERSRYFWQHLLQSNRPRHALLSEIRAYDRYLNDGERNTMRQIAGRVEQKDDLDYQYSLQLSLKCWLFAHVPLTYALLVFAVFHLILVSAFSGGSV